MKNYQDQRAHPAIAFALDYKNDPNTGLIQVDELFEDIRVITDMAEFPAGYVQMFVAEATAPARIMIGRPVARIWKEWGILTGRGAGRAKEGIDQIYPATYDQELAVWVAYSKTHMATIAVTPTPKIPMPEQLEGWQQRRCARSAWIDWK